MNDEPSEQYTPEETARRRDEAIRRALNTPPKPQKGDRRQERQTAAQAITMPEISKVFLCPNYRPECLAAMRVRPSPVSVPGSTNRETGAPPPTAFPNSAWRKIPPGSGSRKTATPSLAWKSGSRWTRRWREMDSNPRSPFRETLFSNPLINGSARCTTSSVIRRNDQVLDAARFKQGDGAIEAGFGASHQKTVGNKGGPI